MAELVVPEDTRSDWRRVRHALTRTRLFRTKSSTFTPGWWRTAKDNAIGVAEMDTAFLVVANKEPEKKPSLPPDSYYC